MSAVLRNAGVRDSEVARLFDRDEPLLRLQRIFLIVADLTSINPERLAGRDTSMPVTRARHFVFYLAHKGDGISCNAIARMTGYDIKSVTYGISVIEARLAELRGGDT